MTLSEQRHQDEVEDVQMVPLNMFLSSSLNTELVFSILSGITQFCLLNFVRNELTVEQEKQFRQMEYRVDRYGDTTITMRKIKIQDIERWDRIKANDMVTQPNNGVSTTLERKTERASTATFRRVITIDGLNKTTSSMTPSKNLSEVLSDK